MACEQPEYPSTHIHRLAETKNVKTVTEQHVNTAPAPSNSQPNQASRIFLQTRIYHEAPETRHFGEIKDTPPFTVSSKKII